MSKNDSASESDSSNSSDHSLFYDGNELTTSENSSDCTFVRSGTVLRRTIIIPCRKESNESTSSTEEESSADIAASNKYRKELFQFRHSLAAISERRNSQKSLSNESVKSNKKQTSVEFSSEDATNDLQNLEKSDNNISPTSSNYLSWIESVHSNFGSASSIIPAQEIDSKVGEWNNFWLNYNNTKLEPLSSGINLNSNNKSEENSSSNSTQDITGKNSMECVILTIEEAEEALKCSKKISEIIGNALKRNEINDDDDDDDEESSTESYYSQSAHSEAQKNSSGKNELVPITKLLSKERSNSYRDNKNFLSSNKPVIFMEKSQFQQHHHQSSSYSHNTSCMDAFLNIGVADMFKRVVLKKSKDNNYSKIGCNKSSTKKSFI